MKANSIKKHLLDLIRVFVVTVSFFTDSKTLAVHALYELGQILSRLIDLRKVWIPASSDHSDLGLKQQTRADIVDELTKVFKLMVELPENQRREEVSLGIHAGSMMQIGMTMLLEGNNNLTTSLVLITHLFDLYPDDPQVIAHLLPLLALIINEIVGWNVEQSTNACYLLAMIASSSLNHCKLML